MAPEVPPSECPEPVTVTSHGSSDFADGAKERVLKWVGYSGCLAGGEAHCNLKVHLTGRRGDQSQEETGRRELRLA